MNEKFMELAIKESLKAYEIEEIPIGAVVVLNGKVIGKGYNKKEKKKDGTMHAEIIAIRSACKKIKDWRLNKCSIYVTVEPCTMCLGAIIESRIENIYCGVKNKKYNETNQQILKFNNIKINFGVCEKAIKEILKKFFILIRNR